ncbi:MAG: hypothetical protein Q9221_001034 [Calogaya cf. arnoldii]
MASRMKEVWGQLSARGIESIRLHFQALTATDTQDIKKVIKTIIEEKIILGHNITESATYVPTEHLIPSTPASIPAVNNTTFLTQSSWTVVEAAGSTSCFGWSVFTALLCIVCLSALVGLCVSFWRYRHLLSLARLSLRLQDHIHHARRFLHISTARIPQIFTSLPYTFTFIGIGIVVLVGMRMVNWAQHNDNEIFTTFVKSTWFLLTGLFYLLRHGGNIVRDWTKNEDEPSSLWDSSNFAASEAFDFGAEFAPDPVTPKRNFFEKSWDWCCTQDIGGMMMTLALFEIEVLGGLVKVILLLPDGLYRIYCRYRESSKQKIIDRMAVEQQAKDAVKDKVIAQKDARINEQKTQLTTSDEKIRELTEERDKYKGLKGQAKRGKVITERQCAVSVANTLREAQWKHLAKITELQAENTALRNQLKAKVDNTEAKPNVPELSTPKLSLENIPQDVLEEIHQHFLANGWQQILREHARFKCENTRLTDENTRVAGEHAVLTHKHNLLTNEHTRISEEHSQFAAERPLAEKEYQQVVNEMNRFEAQVEELKSRPSAQQGKSAEHLDLEKTYADLQMGHNALKAEFDETDAVLEGKKKYIGQLEEQKENNRKALSKALREVFDLSQQLETLRNSSQANAQPSPTNQPPATSQPNSDSAAEVAYTAAFPNGKSKVYISSGANEGYLGLAKSLQFQHNVTVSWADFQAIADSSLNAAHIAAARRDPPDNGLVHDPHQLAKILELWSRQNRGHAAMLGVRSKVISVPGFSYEMMGDDESQLVVWMAKSTSLKTGKTSWGAFGPPGSDGASGSAANA